MRIKDFKLDFNHEVIFDKKILQCEGLTETYVNYETAKNAGADGNIILGQSKESRVISIKVKIDNANGDMLQRYFASKREHTLYIGKRKINCVCELSKIAREQRGNLYEIPVLILQFYCSDPYFYDVYDFGKNLAGIQPMFGFPWSSTATDGFSTGYRIYNSRTVFQNKGDANVGFKIIFKAIKGIAKNIRFTHLGTGEFVEILTDMEQGDKLEISTIEGSKYVKLNKQDIFNSINRKSTFFNISTGDNLLEYSAEEGQTNLDVILYYVPKYTNGLVINN